MKNPPGRVLVPTDFSVGCNLVVMGKHGRRGFKHQFMGSVAEKVARLSPVLVLTVR